MSKEPRKNKPLRSKIKTLDEFPSKKDKGTFHKNKADFSKRGQRDVETTNRKELYYYSHDKGKRSVQRKGLESLPALVKSCANPPHKVIKNNLFCRPLRESKERANASLLKQAISQAKPCIDLRQVRRGRKTFQIPRVIPSTKRRLFGMRRLLSICTSTNALSVSNQAWHTKTDNAKALSSHTKIIEQKSARVNSVREPKHTRSTFFGVNSNSLSKSLFLSLGKEIKACSLFRSQSIENKKLIYKTASANRGAIRMAWWL